MIRSRCHCSLIQSSCCEPGLNPNSDARLCQLPAVRAAHSRSTHCCEVLDRTVLVARTVQIAHPVPGDRFAVAAVEPASRVPDGAVAAEPYCPGVPASSLQRWKPRGCCRGWGLRPAGAHRTTRRDHCDPVGRLWAAPGDRIAQLSAEAPGGVQSMRCVWW